MGILLNKPSKKYEQIIIKPLLNATMASFILIVINIKVKKQQFCMTNLTDMIQLELWFDKVIFKNKAKSNLERNTL
jgi:hypothetical protein